MKEEAKKNDIETMKTVREAEKEQRETDSDKQEKQTEADDANQEEQTESDTDEAEKQKEADKTEQAMTEKKYEDLYETEPFIDPSVYQHRRKKKAGKRRMALVVAGIFVLYFGGVIFHMNCFGTMTTINGIDVSGKSVKAAETLLMKDASAYALTICFKDSEFILRLGDASSEVAFTEGVDTMLKKQSPFLWFIDSFRSFDYTIDYTVSCEEDELKALLETSPSMEEAAMKASVDAKVVLVDGKAEIVPDKTGTRLDKETLYNEIKNAMKQYESILDVEQADCYIPAKVRADSEFILETKQRADAFVEIEATYEFGNYSYTIPKEELTKMAYIDKKGNIRISESNVSYFVTHTLSRFSTAGTEREFVTHDKKTILVYGGYYGWVIDEETETEELLELLRRRESFTKEPACKRTGYTMCEKNDIGSTYVEIDLTNQHVYFYKNGRLKWDSECVSGHTPGHRTPGGLYGLTYKKMYATLIGEDYETPVTYWMPFNGGIGLHDASWRGSFGGNIYTYNGSHGCVNLPTSKAGELFEYVEAGMPIVCYWRDEVTYVEE